MNNMAKDRHRNEKSPYYKMDMSSKYSERRSCFEDTTQSTSRLCKQQILPLEEIRKSIAAATKSAKVSNLETLKTGNKSARNSETETNEKRLNSGSALLPRTTASPERLSSEASFKNSNKLLDITARKEAAKQRVLK